MDRIVQGFGLHSCFYPQTGVEMEKRFKKIKRKAKIQS